MTPPTPTSSAPVGLDAFRALAAPFAPADVRWKIQAVSRDSRRALVLPTLDQHTIMRRLDEALEPTGWSDDFTYDLDGDLVRCRLTIGGASKEGLAAINRAGVERAAAVQLAAREAFTNAAVKFGVGRYLYGIEAQWVDYDAERRRPLETPELPAWALPQRNANMRPDASADVSCAAAASAPGDAVLADLIRELRELPGGDAALRAVMPPSRPAARTRDEQRRLYGELRAAYRRLAHMLPEEERP